MFWLSYADLMTALFIVALALFVLSYRMFQVRALKLEEAEAALRLRSEELDQQSIALEELRLRSLDADKQKAAVKTLTARLDEEEMLAATLIQQLQDERAYLFDLQQRLNEERGRLLVMEEEYKKLREIQKAIQNLDSRYFVYQPEYKRHVLNKQVHFPTGKSEIGSAYKPFLAEAGRALQRMIQQLDPKDNIKYIVVIEGMASQDSYAKNYELSYNRALALYEFWSGMGITFDPNRFEVMIAGSGVGGLGRNQSNEALNQRFLLQIVAKIGTLKGLGPLPGAPGSEEISAHVPQTPPPASSTSPARSGKPAAPAAAPQTRSGQDQTFGPYHISKVIATAESFLGVPHVWGGMGRRGIDCSGLMVVSYSAANLDLPRVSREQAEMGRTVKKAELQPGDLVFFQVEDQINHVGLVTSVDAGEVEFIQSTFSQGVIKSKLSEPFWRKHFVLAKRVWESPGKMAAG